MVAGLGIIRQGSVRFLHCTYLVDVVNDPSLLAGEDIVEGANEDRIVPALRVVGVVRFTSLEGVAAVHALPDPWLPIHVGHTLLQWVCLQRASEQVRRGAVRRGAKRRVWIFLSLCSSLSSSPPSLLIQSHLLVVLRALTGSDHLVKAAIGLKVEVTSENVPRRAPLLCPLLDVPH